MSPIAISLVVFAFVFSGALLGVFLHSRLGTDHLSPESKEAVRLGMALVATTVALVLGLLIASAKNFYDTGNTEIALSRRIGINERMSLYVRVEYFNVFNHPMFSPYNNYVGLPDFGKVTQTLNQSLSGLSPLYQIGGPRSGQFSVKLQF